jgi:segregation and condensation protein A
MENIEAINPASDFEEDEEGARERHLASAALADELLLNLDGFEGPIDILLNLARDQKVDLAKISILALAQQYLLFIDRAQDLKIELAADYLVMAAWLAYLKSRILVPSDDTAEDDGLSGPAMAEALAFQLKRLESIQNVAVELFSQPLLGRDVFMRGALRADGSRLDTETHISYKAGLYDLLTAYGAIARRHQNSVYEIKKYNLVSTDEAMERLTRMLGKPQGYLSSQGGWINLRSFLPEQLTDKLRSRSAVASTFTAGLELVKQGQAEIRQDGLFGAIYFRAIESDASKEENYEQ